jgi:hypothetical protein
VKNRKFTKFLKMKKKNQKITKLPSKKVLSYRIGWKLHHLQPKQNFKKFIKQTKKFFLAKTESKKAISTRKSTISTRRVWFPHKRLWFLHVGTWFLHAECNFVHAGPWFLHAECNFHTQNAISTRRSAISTRCVWL